jgi:hypothetical protein
MLNNSKSSIFCLISLMALLLAGCSVSQQAKHASNLANCDFRIRSVENVNLMGVNVQHVRSVTDLGISDAARIMAGFASPTFPLSLQVNLEGRNPNPADAGMNHVEWMLYIDDILMTSGILDKPFVIPANNGTAIIPVQVAIDLKQAIAGKSMDALLNFSMNLAGMGSKPTRFKIKIKPTIMVGKTPLPMPGYITVKTEYSGGTITL